MRLSKSFSIIAALTFGITGALLINENSANAATVATVTAPGYAHLYTKDGTLITNRGLGTNTPWLVGQTVQINGTTFYQVATNEYLSSKDSTLNTSTNTSSSTLKGKVVLGVSQLFNDQTNSVESNNILGNNTEWNIGRIIVNKYNQVFVQVSSHEYADGSTMLFQQNPTNIERIDDFGLAVENNADDAQKASLGNTTWTNTNIPYNPSGSTTSNKDDTSVSNIQQAILNSMNSERASKGVAPLTLNNALNQTAMTRASEISQSFSHTRPDGSPFYTAFPYLSSFEENIAWRTNSSFNGDANKLASIIMDSFRAETFTPNHYTNVVSTDVNKVGIGVYTANGKTYISEDFSD